jgi:AcrR family transcriptional regulator
MELRDRILTAAAKVYAETGFRGATTRRIAERAGVNEITLFRHFGSKTRLLHEAIHCAGTSSNLCALPARPVDPHLELLEWAMANHAELSARRSLIRTAMGEIEERPDLIPPDRSPTVSACRELDRYLGRLRELEWIDRDTPLESAATMFMGTLFADAMSRDILPILYKHSPEQSVEHYVQFFARAIGLREARS